MIVRERYATYIAKYIYSTYIMCKFKYHVYIARMILIQSYTHKIRPFEVQHAELAKSVNVTRDIAKRKKSLSMGNRFKLSHEENHC